jgi:putative acetyltransferase
MTNNLESLAVIPSAAPWGHERKSFVTSHRAAYRARVLVREERPEDRDAVARLHSLAFADDGVVASLVDDLRASSATETGLSLVAVDHDETVAGHVMFTRNVLDAPPRLVDVQVLSPLGVLPSHQGRGVGGLLVRRGLEQLAGQGVPLVFLEGSPVYYSRFGFQPGGEHGFRRPSLRIPEPAFQVRILAWYEPWMTGTLVYRQAFWDHDSVGLREQPPDDLP